MRIHATLLATFLLFAGVHAEGSATELLPLRAAVTGDQVPDVLMAAPLPSGDSERAPLSFAWALDPMQPLQAPEPYRAVSRSYWQTVDAGELQQGVALPLTASDAVIQISPARGARTLTVDALRLRDGDGGVVATHGVGTAQLRAAGMDVSQGACMLRAGITHAGETYRLQSALAQGTYVVQVLERDSRLSLQVQADQGHVLAGGNIQLRGRLLEDGVSPTQVHARRLGGNVLLVAPDGRRWTQPLLLAHDGELRAQVPIPAEASNVQGLWELQVSAQAEGVKRDAKVAISVAWPTARFTGQTWPDVVSRKVSLQLKMVVAGRYEARGTLYATGVGGRLQPVAQAHAAAWFDGAGQGVLVLPFDQVPLPPGFTGPYELRDLQLHDQSRMALVEARALALRF